MAHILTTQDLKVDATSVPMERASRTLLIYNINIPRDVVENDVLWRDAIERADRLIHNEMRPAHALYYQVVATYYLTHMLTGEEQLWTGSFFSRGNSHAQLGIFREYDNTFIDSVSRDIINIEERLNWFDGDTKWVFDRLESVIVNAQAEVSITQSTLSRRNIMQNVSGRISRNHITFSLP
jgi:hypothetical protein